MAVVFLREVTLAVRRNPMLDYATPRPGPAVRGWTFAASLYVPALIWFVYLMASRWYPGGDHRTPDLIAFLLSIASGVAFHSVRGNPVKFITLMVYIGAQAAALFLSGWFLASVLEVP